MEKTKQTANSGNVSCTKDPAIKPWPPRQCYQILAIMGLEIYGP